MPLRPEYQRTFYSLESIQDWLRKLSKRSRRDIKEFKRLAEEAAKSSDKPIDVQALTDEAEELLETFENIKRLQGKEFYHDITSFDDLVEMLIKDHLLAGVDEKENAAAANKIYHIVDYVNKELRTERRDQRRLAENRSPRTGVIEKLFLRPAKIARQNIKDAHMMDYLKQQKQDLYSQTIHAFAYTAAKTTPDGQQSISHEEYQRAAALLDALLGNIEQEFETLHSIEKDTALLEFRFEKMLEHLKESKKPEVQAAATHLLEEYHQQQEKDLVERRRLKRREGMSRREFTGLFLKGAAAAAIATTVPGQALGAITPSEGLNIIDDFSRRNGSMSQRRSTEYIILHTTHDSKTQRHVRDLNSSARNSVKAGGSCHYLVMTDGKVLRIIHHNYNGKLQIADHAGESLWGQRKGLSWYSIGIEIVGYETDVTTNAQKRSLKLLIKDLQRVYNIPDDHVLPHFLVSCGYEKNAYNTSPYRVRRACAFRYADPSLRKELGLTGFPHSDPNIASKGDIKRYRLQLTTEQRLADAYNKAFGKHVTERPAITSNVISKDNSAWNIAGELYDDEYTIYTFPDGKVKTGSEITDFGALTIGTKVTFGEAEEKQEYRDRRFDEAPVFKELGKDGITLWSLVGKEYASSTTIYFFPDGRIRQGSELDKDTLDHPPQGLKIITGYVYGGKVQPGRMPVQICGRRWNATSTIYIMPGTRKQVLGDDVHESAIPAGTIIIFRK